MPDNTLTKRTWLDKFLDGLERVCNKLPPPRSEERRVGKEC